MPFEIQKALHLSKALEKKSFSFEKYDWAVMEKLDGWYVYIDCFEGKWGTLHSSACREIPALADLSARFQLLTPPKQSTRFIFEATIPGLEFHEMNGILNRRYEQASGVRLNLHDMVTIERAETPFLTRYYDLKDGYFKRMKDAGMDFIHLIPIQEITSNLETFRELFFTFSSEGAEGIIGKNASSGYAFGKRNNDILKLKNEISLDCKIVKYYWTTGDKGNEAMNLLVERTSGAQFPVVVNRHSAIETILTENVIGKVVEIQAMEDLGGSLRQPVFKDFRFNKLEID
jgi:hypothetical protein